MVTRNEALNEITNLKTDEFAKRVKNLKLPAERIRQFLDVIRGELHIDSFLKIDIEEYALKIIFPDVYNQSMITEHLYSTCDLYEFNPAKNGQNVIKHGIGFQDVVSYSKKFGTLIISCPDKNDDERVVLFSDFDLENKYKVELALSSIKSPSCCISIATSRGRKFRFISSRLLSSEKKKYTKTILQSLRSIEFSDEKSKIAFVNRCVEIIERDLI